MNIIQDFIPVGNSNRPGTPIIGPKYITIHDTANSAAGANALMHAKYLKGNEAAMRPASWHFTVDDIQIVQNLPLDEIAWHAGDGHGPGNRSSIGIEICENMDGDRTKAEENAAKLVAHLLKQFGLGLDSVVQHNHWTGKHCPHIIRDCENGWQKFIEKVKGFMTEEKKTNFPDVSDHWAKNAIAAVSKAGIMTGYPDGMFRPDQTVTRGELAKVVNDLLYLINQKGG